MSLFGRKKRNPWASPRWKAYSRLARKVHPWCSICRVRPSKADSLQVHHLQYPPRPLPIWLVLPWNLMVLCRADHAKITALHKGRNGLNHRAATIKYMGQGRYDRWLFLALLPWRLLALLVAGLVLAVALGIW